MKTYIIFIIIVLFANIVNANDISLIVNGKSIHTNYDSDIKLNEKNIGIGVQYDFGNIYDKSIFFLNSSKFIDSKNDDSYYISYGIMKRFMISEKNNYFHFDIGIISILMLREMDNKLKPIIGLLPIINIGFKDISINTTFIPKINQNGADVIFFQLKYLFN